MTIFRKAKEIADGGSVLNFLKIIFLARGQLSQTCLSINLRENLAAE